tara:strand:+ start:8028 stop:9185 length:1158 start_codon:yes stop_codon:yes gene_type:complete
MEIKVKEVTDVVEKSKQQIEQELLDKHEHKQEEESEDKDSQQKIVFKDVDSQEVEVKEKEDVEKLDAQVSEPEEINASELTEEEVLSFIGKRWGESVDSLEELKSRREESEPLSEDVAAFLKYKKETGRGIEDYVKLQRDFSSMNPDSLLKEYLTATEEGLDSEDIDSMMEDYDVDEEIMEPAEIKKLKLAKKKIIAKAKKFFREQQELYKQPLESRESSATATQELEAYRQYVNTAKTQQEEASRQRDWFSKKTNEVFGSEFKGFKFNLNDNEVVYTPGSSADLRKAQDTPLNFAKKFMDEKGLLVDPVGYHRSLAIAMNPEKFAQFFYEQGQATATESVIRKTKNINMSERTAPEVSTKGGFQVKSVSQPSSRGLRIKSIKRT